jgi:murein DD-endopeptidase MepM/ murein hydrolase activator NlpD
MNDRSFLPVGILTVLLVAALLAGAAGIFRVGPPPEIRISPATPVIGKRTPVTIGVSEPGRGLSTVRVELIQNDKTEVLAERTYTPRPTFKFWGGMTASDTILLEVGRDTISTLKPGSVVLRVQAGRAGTFLRHPDPSLQEVTLPVHLTPPVIQVLSHQTYVRQGGGEAVVYRVGATSVRDGVQSSGYWFPGYPLPGGGKQDRFALFAVPYSASQPQVRLVASDAAGNEAEKTFIDQFFPRPQKSDVIHINDEFIRKVVNEILAQSPEIKERGTPLESYLAINNELRSMNATAIKDLAAKSEPSFLWTRPFLMMVNAKVMAGFADRRTYNYQGKEIDRQDHLGYDQAVTARAPIPAANDGTVALARYFGIYGNTVIIDHGYGLMSLYGHMSAIAVQSGQKVIRGQIIGNTGDTGLAGGDHLHFTTLLQGLPVNPAEWWDSHWIKDRIAGKLGAGFKFEPEAQAAKVQSGPRPKKSQPSKSPKKSGSAPKKKKARR